MRRRIGVVVGWFFAVCLLVVGAAPADTRAQRDDTAVRLQVLVNPLDVRPDDVLALVVAMEGDVPDDALVVVRAYEPISDRNVLRAVLDGDAGTTRDRVTLALADIGRTASGHLDLRVPLTSGPLQRGVLQLPRAGVYPLRVELRAAPTTRGDGPVLGEVVTVVHATSSTETTAPLDVSYVAQVTSPPARQADGSVIIDGASLDALVDLVETMERTQAPFSVALPPELVEALSTADDEGRRLWERLANHVGSREVLATPAVTLDPSTAVRSGLADTYTTLLRRGEDEVSNLVGRGMVQRSIQVVTDALDVGGAVLMRDLGTRSVVVTPRAQRALGVSQDIRDLVDTTEMVSLPLGGDSDLPAALVDPELAQRLSEVSDLPSMAALEIVAELLVIRYGTLAALGEGLATSGQAAALARRSLSLSTLDGRPADPALMAQVLERIERTAGLRAVTASQAGASTGVAIANGLVVQLPLLDTAGDDLSTRAEAMFVLSLDTYTVASMLPDGDPRPTVWADQVWRLAASDLTPQQVEAGLALVRDRLDEVRQAVTVPSVNDITLGGRRSTIRLKLRNTAPHDVRIAVRLESAKLSFPSGQELVDLPADSITEVEIPVEVRSNGRFPVSVTLLTPEGDVPLGQPVEFAARATALTGLGQVVTVAGGLILASWWFRHGRARRKARLEAGGTS